MPSDIAAAEPSAEQLADRLTAARAQLHAVRLIIEGGPTPLVLTDDSIEARTKLHSVGLIVDGPAPVRVESIDDRDALAAELRQAEGTLECLRIIAER